MERSINLRSSQLYITASDARTCPPPSTIPFLPARIVPSVPRTQDSSQSTPSYSVRSSGKIIVSVPGINASARLLPSVQQSPLRASSPILGSLIFSPRIDGVAIHHVSDLGQMSRRRMSLTSTSSRHLLDAQSHGVARGSPEVLTMP